MKIAFFGIKDWEIEYIKSKLGGFKSLFFEDKYESKYRNQILDIDILSVFVSCIIGKKELSELKNLKFIATRSTGYDHIDLEACKKANILVSNVPIYGDRTVAEHTFALILTLFKKIYTSVDRVKGFNFSIEGLRGFDLKGKTIGVVGTGNIGKQVVKIAKGFDMNVIAYDIYQSKELVDNFGVKYVDLKYLYSNSDIVTFHVPYNKHTHHMVNLSNLKDFKKGCYLINTARGGVCDGTALLRGYNDRTFAGIGLDVLEEEVSIREELELLATNFKEEKRGDYRVMAIENRLLIKRKNVIVTPHNAFNTEEALKRILDTTVENIEAFAKKKPINLVN